MVTSQISFVDVWQGKNKIYSKSNKTNLKMKWPEAEAVKKVLCMQFDAFALQCIHFFFHLSSMYLN